MQFDFVAIYKEQSFYEYSWLSSVGRFFRF